jgi:hypothetical protein
MNVQGRDIGQSFAMVFKHLAKMTVDFIFDQAEVLKSKFEQKILKVGQPIKLNFEQMRVWENYWIECFRQ